MALYLRSLNPEERVEFVRKSRAKAQAAILSARDEITKVPPECETFVQELRARTHVAVVTPAILGLNIAIFIGMCFGTGALKNFVHHFLKDHDLVERFAFAAPDKGGNGATVAELKLS